jgi:hypothetical protein
VSPAGVIVAANFPCSSSVNSKRRIYATRPPTFIIPLEGETNSFMSDGARGT